MSKQSEAKKSQGYTLKSKMCMNCTHYESEKRMEGWKGQYFTESKLRCGFGGFKINKTATCNKHESDAK